MQGLFDLFGNNPLLLFFVIAAILSFFQGLGGKKENRDSGGPAKRGQTTTTTQRQDEVDWREIFRQEQAPSDHGNEQQRTATSQSTVETSTTIGDNSLGRETEAEKANRDLQERYERIQKKKSKAMEKLDKIQDSPILANDITKKSTPKVELDFSNISREEAIKGIVWSEILGKPKARRQR